MACSVISFPKQEKGGQRKKPLNFNLIATDVQVGEEKKGQENEGWSLTFVPAIKKERRCCGHEALSMPDGEEKGTGPS